MCCTAQELVERALAASTADGQVTFVTESLRGQPPLGGQQPDHQRRDALAARRRRLVRRRRRRHGGRHRGPHRDAGRRGAGRRQRAGGPRRRTGRGRRAAGQRDAAGHGDWDADPAETSIEVFADFAPALGQAFGEARDRDELLFGFAEHSHADDVPRHLHRPAAAHDQPTGRVELNGKSPDFSRSVWAGVGTRDFRDVSVADLAADVEQQDGLVGSDGSSCPRAGTRRCCRRRPSAT